MYINDFITLLVKKEVNHRTYSDKVVIKLGNMLLIDINIKNNVIDYISRIHITPLSKSKDINSIDLIIEIINYNMSMDINNWLYDKYIDLLRS